MLCYSHLFVNKIRLSQDYSDTDTVAISIFFSGFLFFYFSNGLINTRTHFYRKVTSAYMQIENICKLSGIKRSKIMLNRYK
jgi:hypothetical protein